MRGVVGAIRAGVATALLCLVFWAVSVAAQTATGPVVPPEWESVASRAEMAVDAADASDAALQELRAEVAGWREQFLAAQTTNETRIGTLREQIAALGPVPAEGESEPAEIASRRAELNRQLAELEAPRRAADEAYSRANGLVAEIDGILRDRRADQILRLGPSPLNPSLWAPALSAAGETVQDVGRELSRNWRNPIRQSEFRRALPATIALMVVAVALLLRGRRWMERLTMRALERKRNEGRDALVFLVSLGQVILPVIGLLAFAEAMRSSQLMGTKTAPLVAVLPVMGFWIFGARWLGLRVFPRSDALSSPLDLPHERRAEGRWYATTLGILIAIAVLLRALGQFPEHGIETLSVLAFPLVVTGGVVLFRLGQFLIRTGNRDSEEEEGSALRTLVLKTAGRALAFVGLGGPVLAAIGYFTAAEAVLFPTAITLALVALIAVVHAPIRDLYAVIRGLDEAQAREALLPVLITLVLSLCSLPILALIWGAQATDLQEVWTQFREGVRFGETTIAPGDFVLFAVVFLIGYALTRLVQGTLKSTVLPRTKLDAGGRNAITSGIGYFGIFLAALAAITAAGINLSSLAIVAGALSVGIGFGLQNIVSNFVSGIILLIERPISEGDWIEVGGQMGIVKDISVRSTRIETFDRRDVIVPNADFVSGTVTNWTRGNLIGRVTVSVGVSYAADSKRVEEILYEICSSHPMVSMNPPPRVFFRRFGADSLEFDCNCVLRDVNYILSVHSEINHEIHKRFREEGIEIPFAQRDVWLRNPEALPGAAPPAAPPAPAKEGDDG